MQCKGGGDWVPKTGLSPVGYDLCPPETDTAGGKQCLGFFLWVHSYGGSWHLSLDQAFPTHPTHPMTLNCLGTEAAGLNGAPHLGVCLWRDRAAQAGMVL